MAINGINDSKPLGCDEKIGCSSTGSTGDVELCKECMNWLNTNTDSSYALGSECTLLDPMLSLVQCKWWLEKTD